MYGHYLKPGPDRKIMAQGLQGMWERSIIPPQLTAQQNPNTGWEEEEER